jgi:hypothetical protein
MWITDIIPLPVVLISVLFQGSQGQYMKFVLEQYKYITVGDNSNDPPEMCLKHSYANLTNYK